MFTAYVKFDDMNEIRIPRPRPAKSTGWKTQQEVEKFLDKWAKHNINENAQGRVYYVENGEKSLVKTIAL